MRLLKPFQRNHRPFLLRKLQILRRDCRTENPSHPLVQPAAYLLPPQPNQMGIQERVSLQVVKRIHTLDLCQSQEYHLLARQDRIRLRGRINMDHLKRIVILCDGLSVSALCLPVSTPNLTWRVSHNPLVPVSQFLHGRRQSPRAQPQCNRA
jgi:hypothetical protein